MPAKFAMTWEPKPRRWRKVHQGKSYTVSCRELKTKDTKEDSYQAANAWWAGKRAEIEAAGRWPNQEVVESLIEERNKAVEAGAWPEVEELHGRVVQAADHRRTAQEAERIATADEPDLSHHRLALAREAGITIPDGTDPQVLAYLFGNSRIKLDRGRKKPPVLPVEESVTMSAHVKAYLAFQEGRVQAGDICPGDHVNNVRLVRLFEAHVGPQTPVTAINATTLESYYTVLKKKVQARKEDPEKRAGYSTIYAFGAFGYARTFLRYLWSKGAIELPRNLEYRGFTFKRPPQIVPTMTVAEVRRLIDGSNSQLKLHLLLMCNCGMTQTDVSDLRDEEVDWDAGRVRRKRSKTKDDPNVPLVDYKLWPLTFDLLKRWRSGGEIVLLTKYGTRWVWEEWKNGKYRGCDSITSVYRDLHRQLRKTDAALIKRPIKLLRKTSASLIESHREFGRYKTHFLGHSPVGIADRHYAAPSTALFDEVVEWLGQQYGYLKNSD